MEHVGPLALSLQKALRVNKLESEVYFVSAILSTLIRVLNEKSDEKEHLEIQLDTVGENDLAQYDSKSMVTEQWPAEFVEAIPNQCSINSLENVANSDGEKEKECKTSPEDENTSEERSLNNDEKGYILESVSKQIQTISRSIQNQAVNCDLCDFSASEKKPFQEVRMHYMKVHFMCNLCGKQHSSESDLKKHMEGLHRQGIDTLVCNIDDCNHRENMLSEKGEVELKFRSLYVHIRQRHSTFEYSCNLCETKLASEQDLKDHLAIQHDIAKGRIRRFQCPDCEKVFNRGANLRAHIKATHTVYPPLNCKLCKFVALYSGNLKKHIVTAHEEKTIKCDDCYYKVKHATTMEKHIESEHRREYTCEVCSYNTKDKKSFRRHLFIHGEDGAYKCSTCDFRTKTPDSLKTHEKYHKPPQYICDACEYTSHNQANFSTHKKTKHGNPQHKCITCGKMFLHKRHLLKHESKHVLSLNVENK